MAGMAVRERVFPKEKVRWRVREREGMWQVWVFQGLGMSERFWMGKVDVWG